MKTLYISDLDGTLLDKNAEITVYTKDVINRFVANGGHFTVATARTLDTVLHILDGVKLSVPAVLLNGVSVYDTDAREYKKIETIEPCCAAELFVTLAGMGVTGFVYTLENNDLAYYYENLDAPHRKQFHDERSEKYGRVYIKVNSFSELCDREITYFSTGDDYAALSPLYERLKTDARLHLEFYRDIYHTDIWYLEVCPASASKFNAVLYIKESYGFDRVVAFGDNLNDLPLFRASDECYAVANARAELKAQATAVIGANCQDGVAKWMEENAK